MLFEFGEADLEPLDHFTLKWRWTNASYAVLPERVLERIRPVGSEKATLIDGYVRDRVLARHPHPGLIDPEAAEDLRAFRTLHEPEDHVRDWLLSLPIPPDEVAIVSWDARTAVIAPFSVVAEYWSDFFYPASDDAVVIPKEVEWMLVWHHEEAFEFGVARADAATTASAEPGP